MTDARLPDRWLLDRRLLPLSDAGFRLFVTALMWSVANRTDGWLSKSDLAFMPGVDTMHAAELTEGGLWLVMPQDSWLITDFAETQTSAHDLEVLANARRRERDKKRRQRAAVPGDRAGVLSPGTAKDRKGKDRLGKEVPAKLGTTAGGLMAAPGPPPSRRPARPAGRRPPDSPLSSDDQGWPDSYPAAHGEDHPGLTAGEVEGGALALELAAMKARLGLSNERIARIADLGLHSGALTVSRALRGEGRSAAKILDALRLLAAQQEREDERR